MKVSRSIALQPVAPRVIASTMSSALRDIRHSRGLQPLAVFRRTAGTVHHLPLQLAAGGVDVVAAGASHRRDHAGVVELLLEGTDGGIVRALEAGARERVERDQVDLGRVL